MTTPLLHGADTTFKEEASKEAIREENDDAAHEKNTVGADPSSSGSSLTHDGLNELSCDVIL